MNGPEESGGVLKVEFKEKTYEKYVSQELGRLTNISFSPDQCDENALGFDDAFQLGLPHVFLVAPFVRRRRRSRLAGVTIAQLDLLAEEALRHMPPFRFNLFIQYKRPDYLTSKGAGEWSAWKQAYYRFDITAHQQELLQKIDQASHGRAVTVYAAAAFSTSDALYSHAEARAVIDHSAFADVKRLVGHGKYSYVSPGNVGMGHSEPAGIQSGRLRESVATALSQNDVLDAATHVIKTAGTITEVIQGDDQANALFTRTRRILEEGQPSNTELGKALDALVAFTDAFEVSTRMFG